MKQLNVAREMFVVATFAAAVAWAQGDAPVSTAGKGKPASDAVRASDVGKSDGADAKDAPPACDVVEHGVDR